MNLSVARAIFQFNFASFIIWLCFLYTVLANRTLIQKVTRLFFIATLLVFFLTIADNVRMFTALNLDLQLFRFISSSLGYVLRPLILYIFVLITNRNENGQNWGFIVPVLINCIIVLINIPTGLMFSFSETGKLVHGIFGYFPHIISFVYIVLIISFSFKNYRTPLSESIVLIIVCFFGILATVLEHIFKFDLILSQTMLAGSVFYYLFLNIQIYKRDTLTNLLNRRSFYLDLKYYQKNSFIIVSMDLNDLKVINDSMGHAAGDQALITAADNMIACFKNCGNVYRTGGDEFMAILPNTSEDKARKIVNLFESKMSETLYSVACGCSEYFPGNDIEVIISLSDAEMYEHKRIMKNREER